MSTSGTYLFASPQSEQLITDAYERIGKIPGTLTEEDIQTAQRSLNFILTSWINKGLNLWTVKSGMIALTANQSAYNLPSDVSTILEATIRTSNRNLGGTAFSSAGGVAANAFDNNPNTACTQNAPDGNISYNWNNSQMSISMVGVQSNVTTTYDLVAEYSLDNVTWVTAVDIDAKIYPVGEIQWFVVPAPRAAAWFRVRETGGATLNIQELYFNSLVQDTLMSAASRNEYISYPLKGQTGRPGNYYLDRQISPVVYLWPTPSSQYNNMYFTYVKQIQDVGRMIDNAEIPWRFLEALCSKLAHMLALKRTNDLAKVQLLGAMADMEYETAGKEDRERVPMRLYGDYQGYPI